MPDSLPDEPGADDAAHTAALLSAATSGTEKGERIAHTASRGEGVLAIAVGLLIAGFLLACVFVFPQHNLAVSLALVFGYGIALVGVSLWYRAQRRASGRGWHGRYSRAFGLSMTFYAVGIALSVSMNSQDWRFWGPYAALTAAPLVVAGLRPEQS